MQKVAGTWRCGGGVEEMLSNYIQLPICLKNVRDDKCSRVVHTHIGLDELNRKDTNARVHMLEFNQTWKIVPTQLPSCQSYIYAIEDACNVLLSSCRSIYTCTLESARRVRAGSLSTCIHYSIPTRGTTASIQPIYTYATSYSNNQLSIRGSKSKL